MARAVDFVEGEARRVGWAEADRSRLALATAEAAANAVKHGGGAEGAPTFTVRCRVDADGAVVTVLDGGPGPAPEAVQTARLPESVFATGGRGLHIMRQLADRVDVEGGAVRLRFSRS